MTAVPGVSQGQPGRYLRDIPGDAQGRYRRDAGTDPRCFPCHSGHARGRDRCHGEGGRLPPVPVLPGITMGVVAHPWVTRGSPVGHPWPPKPFPLGDPSPLRTLGVPPARPAVQGQDLLPALGALGGLWGIRGSCGALGALGGLGGLVPTPADAAAPAGARAGPSADPSGPAFPLCSCPPLFPPGFSPGFPR